ncbi:MAG: 4-amino-4-deoxy-L-arabinose transferase-like glycosyltransferase [Cyclobacteriaceae bacterium]|jgi:4-amino-4-deoxy-L-arabinose transferase-like glycosyltransferase
MTARTKNYLLIGLVFLLTVSLFHRLDYLPIKFEEPRRALVTMEMELSGDLLHPTINGRSYYNKPPIYNWVLLGLFKAFGHELWVIRLPTVLSLIALTLAHFLFFRKRIGHEQALWSALFIPTSVNILYYFSFQGEIDMFYTLIVYLQMLSILHYYDQKDYWRLFIVSYLLLSVGVLTKGIPSIGFQGLTLIGLMLFDRRFKWFFSVQHLVGGVMAISLMTSYFWLYGSTGGQSLNYVAKLFFEGSRRTVDNSESFSFISSFLQFPGLLAYLLMPWLLFGLINMSLPRLRFLWSDRWFRYSGIFLLSNLPLYWLSSGVRDRYLYMFLPFLCLWVIGLVVSDTRPKLSRYFTTGMSLVIVLAAIFTFSTSYASYPSVPLILSVTICIGLLLALFTYRDQIPVLMAWLTLLILFRFAFNIIVFEDRHRHDIRFDSELTAQQVAALCNGKPLKYYSPQSTETIALPLTTSSVTYPVFDRLDFGFSYHYEKNARQILLHTDQLNKAGFYLYHEGETVDLPHNRLGTFEIARQTYYLIEL